MKNKSSVVITKWPLSISKEKAFASTSKDRVLINSICEYRKQIEKEDKEVFARKDNLLVCEDGYYIAFYEDDLIAEETDPTPFKGEDGRMKVMLHGEKKSGVEDLAKLVATAFIPNPQNFPDVSFKDGNAGNVNADNLFWTVLKNKEE